MPTTRRHARGRNGPGADIAAPSVKKLQFVVHDFVDGFDTYTEKLGYTWPGGAGLGLSRAAAVARRRGFAPTRPGLGRQSAASPLTK